MTKDRTENKDALFFVSETIVVEGRDDTNAVKRAVDAVTIETHGFGISGETWRKLEAAYHRTGLIIFTDPDHAGEEIRKRIKEKFPEAKEAFLIAGKASKKGDIGIENAKPEDIREALIKAKATVKERSEKVFTEKDLSLGGLSGEKDSRERREKLGDLLGIGYSNAKGLLAKLNSLGITREEFLEALSKLD